MPLDTRFALLGVTSRQRIALVSRRVGRVSARIEAPEMPLDTRFALLGVTSRQRIEAPEVPLDTRFALLGVTVGRYSG